MQAYILLPFVVIKIGEGWLVWPAISKTLQYIVVLGMSNRLIETVLYMIFYLYK